MKSWSDLVGEAKAKCAGCRYSWPLFRTEPGGDHDKHADGTLCQAIEIRRRIRAIPVGP